MLFVQIAPNSTLHFTGPSATKLLSRSDEWLLRYAYHRYTDRDNDYPDDTAIYLHTNSEQQTASQLAKTMEKMALMYPGLFTHLFKRSQRK